MKHGLIKIGSTDGTGTEVDAMKLKRKSSIFYGTVHCVFDYIFFSMATKKCPDRIRIQSSYLLASWIRILYLGLRYRSADPDPKEILTDPQQR
jgi:hypothetical protein